MKEFSVFLKCFLDPSLKKRGKIILPENLYLVLSLGSDSITDFEGQFGETKTSPAFFQAGEVRTTEEGLELDGCSQLSGKKRRLSAHQVHFLEMSFGVENRLEPERKAQLAKELGLQPRQVAVWFQNRRARFKTKQMEKDYDSLRASYDALKANRDSLLKEKDNLKHEVSLLERVSKKKYGWHPILRI